ncbi:MAG: hypothetical protein KDD40_13005, partial [Bdellovibrionales bacterium]|nr:hypothetical protein [Bdellovibrionales bacterium]
VQKIKAKNNELRSSLDHQVQLQNQDAQAMSDFDFLVQRFTQAYNENQNILQQNLQELHNNLLQLRPNGDYRVVEKVVEKANSLSPHEFNRWLMQLFWRFVKYPQDRVAIYVMWSYLANKNYAVKQAVNQIVKVQTNADQEIDPETSTSEENTVQQRMNNAALILSLVHGDALLQPAHIEIPLFTVPQTNKKWEWSVRVIRSIEGQRGYLNDAQQDLNLEWSRAPLVELAAQEMSGKSSDVQDDSFYQRWILGDSFEQTEESNWTIRFKQTALDIFPMFSQAKLKAESLFPLFVHLAANRFTCNAQDMVGIIKNSFDPSILLKDITNATNIIEKEAQKVALRLQPGRTSLVDNFAVLSNIIPLVGRHNFI